MEDICIKYWPGVPHLEQTSYGSWIDLYVREGMWLKKGEYAQIPLGVAMKLPQGYEAIMAPRSSMFKRTGLIQTNGIGVIDESYCGPDDEWCLPVLATKDIGVPEGYRLCQFRIIKSQPEINFIESDLSSEVNRDGFGSTGV